MKVFSFDMCKDFVWDFIMSREGNFQRFFLFI